MTASPGTQYMREWINRPGNRERKREANRRSYAKAKAAGKITKYNSERHRFLKHGTTKEAFEAMIAEHGGGCQICGCEGTWETLVVDHDHACCSGQYSCGKCIRGALCTRCNTALGLFGDDPDLLGRAIAYVTRSVNAT